MTVGGEVAPGWEPVREAFEANFRDRGEIGAGVVMFHRGRVVVDLHGGVADPQTGRPWTAHTPGIVFSATKGLVAACFLMLVDRGLLDLDAPASLYWPELARNGKESITPRMILLHRAGLSAIDAPLHLFDLRDHPEQVHEALIAQVPLWTPDTDQGYAACSYGLYTQELFRRITGKSLGTFLAEEIAGPLGMETSLGRPDALPEPPARLIPTDLRTLVRHQLLSATTRRNAEGQLFRRVMAGRRSTPGRAFLNPTLGKTRFEALNDPEVQAIELPWMNAISTAGGLARMYAALAGDGSLDGVRLVRPETLRPLRRRQSWNDRDRVMCKPLGFSQGFVKDELQLFSPNPAAFGHPGAGGALGWADPDAQLAIGYVMNRMDWRIRSPRAVALCHAAYAALADLGSVGAPPVSES